MIAIQFQKRDFEYDVYNLVKSFYPEEEIVLSDDDSPAAEYDEKISLFYGKNKISIRIERVSGDRKRQEEGVWLTEEMHGRKERKNQTKILLYHMLQKRTGHPQVARHHETDAERVRRTGKSESPSFPVSPELLPGLSAEVLL